MTIESASTTPGSVDYFVSYTGVDEQWAEWIAWCLEEAGYRILLQAWDFRPGDNLVLMMQKASILSRRTLVVLTDSYLEAIFTQPEWAATFRLDPESKRLRLVPVRVKHCSRPGGLLDSIIYIDLVDCAEDEARRRLLAGLRPGRGKPMEQPMFPGLAVSAPLGSTRRSR